MSHPGPLSGTAIDFGLVGVSGSKIKMSSPFDIYKYISDIDNEFHIDLHNQSFGSEWNKEKDKVTNDKRREKTYLARVNGSRQLG